MTALEITNLYYAYERNDHVLIDINLSINSGEIVSILGPSGCGKTTLLRIIAGLEDQLSGAIKINGKIVANENFILPPEKRCIGLVVQDKALFPHLNVLDNVSFGIQKDKNKYTVAKNYLGLFEVDKLAYKFPHEISGGEQQRVALARAMAPCPDILLLDEPFSALDQNLKSQLHHETKKIFKKKGVTVLIVSHDEEEACFLSDRLIYMDTFKIKKIMINSIK
jgi:iron(III) transport system ATP-binding protein